jgi:hypothetical protein
MLGARLEMFVGQCELSSWSVDSTCEDATCLLTETEQVIEKQTHNLPFPGGEGVVVSRQVLMCLFECQWGSSPLLARLAEGPGGPSTWLYSHEAHSCPVRFKRHSQVSSSSFMLAPGRIPIVRNRTGWPSTPET